MRLQIQLISAAAKQSQAAARLGQREWGGQPAGEDVGPRTLTTEASPGRGQKVAGRGCLSDPLAFNPTLPTAPTCSLSPASDASRLTTPFTQVPVACKTQSKLYLGWANLTAVSAWVHICLAQHLTLE